MNNQVVDMSVSSLLSLQDGAGSVCDGAAPDGPSAPCTGHRAVCCPQLGWDQAATHNQTQCGDTHGQGADTRPAETVP